MTKETDDIVCLVRHLIASAKKQYAGALDVNIKNIIDKKIGTLETLEKAILQKYPEGQA